MSIMRSATRHVSSRRLRRAAAAVASKVGIAIIDGDEIGSIGLGPWKTSVFLRAVDVFDGAPVHPNGATRKAPPPTIIGVSAPLTVARSVVEMRRRLAVVLLLYALVGDDRCIDAIPAALAFARHVRREFGSVDPLIAEADCLAWRAAGGDLSAWVALRFTATPSRFGSSSTIARAFSLAFAES